MLDINLDDISLLIVSDKLDQFTVLDSYLQEQGLWIWHLDNIEQVKYYLPEIVTKYFVILYNEPDLEDEDSQRQLQHVLEECNCLSIVITSDEEIVYENSSDLFENPQVIILEKPIDSVAFGQLLYELKLTNKAEEVKRFQESKILEQSHQNIEEGIKRVFKQPLELIDELCLTHFERMNGQALKVLQEQLMSLQDIVCEIELLEPNEARELINLHELIKQASEELQEQSESTIKYNWKLHPEDISIAANPQLSHAFFQVLKNAAESMKHEGFIDISTQLNMRKQVEVRVKDYGHGIQPDVQKQIFDPFFTQKSQRGLGLNIALDIIRHFKGHLSVESSHPNQGTCVLMKFAL